MLLNTQVELAWLCQGKLGSLTMTALSDYPMNPIYTDKALGILQHHLREVAEHQHASELSTNNILTSQRLEVIELGIERLGIFHKEIKIICFKS